MKQAARFIRKGDMPIASESNTILRFRRNIPGGNATAPFAEKLELPRQRDDLRHNGSDGSATYAPAETIDKHRVEYGIDNHRGYGWHTSPSADAPKSVALHSAPDRGA